jgi:hypothetical protein
MSPTFAGSLRDDIMMLQEVDNVIPKVQRQICTRCNLRCLAAVAVLEFLTHIRFFADNPWKFLAQCINEAITPCSASTAEVIGVTINFDFKRLALIPKRFSMGLRLFDTVA